MNVVRTIVIILVLSGLHLGQSASAQEKPEWRFSVLASVSERTAQFYGGLEAAKEKIKEQFVVINGRYNNPNVFDGRFNFSVDSVRLFSGAAGLQYVNPLTGFDYQIVYDMYSGPRANWIGSPINTVALQIPHSDGYPGVLDLKFAKHINPRAWPCPRRS